MPDVQKNKYSMCLPAALFELFKHGGVKIQKDQEWIFVLDDEFFSNSFTNMIVRTASITVVPDDCAVTIVNSNSKKLVEHCKRAYYLIIVTKNPEYVQPEWLKPGNNPVASSSKIVLRKLLPRPLCLMHRSIWFP